MGVGGLYRKQSPKACLLARVLPYFNTRYLLFLFSHQAAALEMANRAV